MNNILPTDETSSAISKMHELNVTYRGTGKSVLFLHGLLASRSYWGRVIEGLDALKYATYTFDLLGFGDSPKPKTATYDVDTQVDNVYAYIKKNKLKSFTLVGHSMGSLVAIRFAVKYPELVNKLILCNTPLFTDGQDIRQVIAASRHGEGHH